MLLTSSQRKQMIISSSKHDLKCQSFFFTFGSNFSKPPSDWFSGGRLLYILSTFAWQMVLWMQSFVMHLWEIDFNNKVIDKGCVFENHTFNHVLMATSLSNSFSHFLFHTVDVSWVQTSFLCLIRKYSLFFTWPIRQVWKAIESINQNIVLTTKAVTIYKYCKNLYIFYIYI